MTTPAQVRELALSLPRTQEHLIRDQVKFRVGRLVYLTFSRDERAMGLAFPKEERAALVAAQPHRFFLPKPSDLRFNWIEMWLAEVGHQEMRELVVDAWRMVVPQRVAAAHLATLRPPGT